MRGTMTYTNLWKASDENYLHGDQEVRKEIRLILEETDDIPQYVIGTTYGLNKHGGDIIDLDEELRSRNTRRRSGEMEDLDDRRPHNEKVTSIRRSKTPI